MTQPLVVTHQVPADREQVFEAFTTTEGLQRWWWAQVDDARYEVDGSVGGVFYAHSDTLGKGVRGEFLDLFKPCLVLIKWAWEGANVDEREEEQVRLDFTSHSGGTLVVVTHYYGHDVQDPAVLRKRWDYLLDQLTARFTTTDA